MSDPNLPAQSDFSETTREDASAAEVDQAREKGSPIESLDLQEKDVKQNINLRKGAMRYQSWSV